MENYNEKTADILNDLLQINHDRIEGYEKAVDQLEDSDSDLKAIYNKMASQSRAIAGELEAEVVKLGEKPAQDTTLRGKIYRAWMSVKDTFTGDDRQATLNACEYGEDAAQKAYETALSTDFPMDPSVQNMIAKQKQDLRSSHDEIKRMRDQYQTTH